MKFRFPAATVIEGSRPRLLTEEGTVGVGKVCVLITSDIKLLDSIGVMKGDARSSDYSSSGLLASFSISCRSTALSDPRSCL